MAVYIINYHPLHKNSKDIHASPLPNPHSFSHTLTFTKLQNKLDLKVHELSAGIYLFVTSLFDLKCKIRAGRQMYK